MTITTKINVTPIWYFNQLNQVMSTVFLCINLIEDPSVCKDPCYEHLLLQLNHAHLGTYMQLHYHNST
ncbi:unnamed protein product [Cunninghamella echinulata]